MCAVSMLNHVDRTKRESEVSNNHGRRRNLRQL